MAKKKVPPLTRKESGDSDVSLLAQPLGRLARRVAKAVLKELMRQRAEAPKKRSKRGTRALLDSLDLQDLEAALPAMVERALFHAMTARTRQGTALRMSLIAALAQAEMAGEAKAGSSRHSEKSDHGA